MIEEVDIEALRQEGLQDFRKSIETRIQVGPPPDADFVKAALILAIKPILRAICGEDVNPEDHIKIDIETDVTPEGQLMTYTLAEGLTPYGTIAVESFMAVEGMVLG